MTAPRIRSLVPNNIMATCMSHPIYSRLSGFGWTMVPLAPFRIERIAYQSRSIIAAHRSAKGARRAAMAFDSAEPVVRLDEGTASLDEVLELVRGVDCDYWRVETSVYSVRWPDGFAVSSISDPPGFEFVGPEGILLFLQGPFERQNLPALAEMAVLGQSIAAIGPNWVQLGYLLEGTPWQQTHHVVPYGTDFVVVTSQAPLKMRVLADAACSGVAESLTPFRPG